MRYACASVVALLVTFAVWFILSLLFPLLLLRCLVGAAVDFAGGIAPVLVLLLLWLLLLLLLLLVLLLLLFAVVVVVVVAAVFVVVLVVLSP